MQKVISSVLSVLILLTGVVPSYAQALEAVSRQKNRVTGVHGFMYGGGNSFENAVQRSLQNAWANRPETLTARAAKWVEADYGSYHWNGCIDNLLRAENNQVCRDGECMDADLYAHGCARYGFTDAYYQGQPIPQRAKDLSWLVTSYGTAQNDTARAQKYFRDIIKVEGKSCEIGFFIPYGSSARRADKNRQLQLQGEICEQVTYALTGLAGLETPATQADENARIIYDFINKYYREGYGSAVLGNGVAALMLMDTAQSFALLKKFLLEDSLKAGLQKDGLWSRAKSVLENFTVSGTVQNITSLANNMRGGQGRYLNAVSENFQYIDKEEAARQGYAFTEWRAETLQYPMGNVLEDIGVMIASDDNPRSKALARQIMQRGNAAAAQDDFAARLHLPLLTGVILGGDNWKNGLGGNYLTLQKLYGSDWWDLNEGTQRRIHNLIARQANKPARLARPWNDNLPKDPEKLRRSVLNERGKDMAIFGDAALTVLAVTSLVGSLPALGSRAATFLSSLKLRRLNALKIQSVRMGALRRAAVQKPAAATATPKRTEMVAKMLQKKPAAAPKAYFNKPYSQLNRVQKWAVDARLSAAYYTDHAVLAGKAVLRHPVAASANLGLAAGGGSLAPQVVKVVTAEQMPSAALTLDLAQTASAGTFRLVTPAKTLASFSAPVKAVSSAAKTADAAKTLSAFGSARTAISMPQAVFSVAPIIGVLPEPHNGGSAVLSRFNVNSAVLNATAASRAPLSFPSLNAFAKNLGARWNSWKNNLPQVSFFTRNETPLNSGASNSGYLYSGLPLFGLGKAAKSLKNAFTGQNIGLQGSAAQRYTVYGASILMGLEVATPVLANLGRAFGLAIDDNALVTLATYLPYSLGALAANYLKQWIGRKGTLNLGIGLTMTGLLSGVFLFGLDGNFQPDVDTMTHFYKILGSITLASFGSIFIQSSVGPIVTDLSKGVDIQRTETRNAFTQIWRAVGMMGSFAFPVIATKGLGYDWSFCFALPIPLVLAAGLAFNLARVPNVKRVEAPASAETLAPAQTAAHADLKGFQKFWAGVKNSDYVRLFKEDKSAKYLISALFFMNAIEVALTNSFLYLLPSLVEDSDLHGLFGMAQYAIPFFIGRMLAPSFLKLFPNKNLTVATAMSIAGGLLAIPFAQSNVYALTAALMLSEFGTSMAFSLAFARTARNPATQDRIISLIVASALSCAFGPLLLTKLAKNLIFTGLLGPNAATVVTLMAIPTVLAFISAVMLYKMEMTDVDRQWQQKIKNLVVRGFNASAPGTKLTGTARKNMIRDLSAHKQDIVRGYHLPKNYVEGYYLRRIHPYLNKVSYVPDANKNVVYRGMYITVDELAAVLKNGLPVVSFSSSSQEASAYVFHSASLDKHPNGVGVVFKVKKTAKMELLENPTVNPTGTIYHSYKDVPPGDILEVYVVGQYGLEDLPSVFQQIKNGKELSNESWVNQFVEGGGFYR